MELFERTVQLARQTGDRRVEGSTLVATARALRRRGRELGRAERLLEEAEVLLGRPAPLLEAALLWCERGLLRLARGWPARDCLEALEALLAEAGAEAGSQPQVEAARLRRAIQSAELSRPLLWGECPEDVPPAVRAAAEGPD
jgi:hypothetical protein